MQTIKIGLEIYGGAFNVAEFHEAYEPYMTAQCTTVYVDTRYKYFNRKYNVRATRKTRYYDIALRLSETAKHRRDTRHETRDLRHAVSFVDPRRKYPLSLKWKELGESTLERAMGEKSTANLQEAIR